MDNQALQIFGNILAKLTAVLVTLSSLLSSAPVASPAQGHHFGIAAPNVNVNGTPVQPVGSLLQISSYDTPSGNYTLSSSSVFYVGTSTAVGNNTSFNGVGLWVIASSTYVQGSTSGTILAGNGQLQNATSTVISISNGIPSGALSVGDPCFASLNITSTAFGVLTGCQVTAASGTLASTTISYANTASTSSTIPTSTVVHIEIHHLPF